MPTLNELSERLDVLEESTDRLTRTVSALLFAVLKDPAMRDRIVGLANDMRTIGRPADAALLEEMIQGGKLPEV